MGLGICLLLTSGCLLVGNQRQASAAAQASQELLTELLTQMEMAPAETGETQPEPVDTEMTQKEIDGYSYIGYLSIPKLELELPVMSQWDYERLKIAPCWYSGSTKSDDLVLLAHNFYRHFGQLKKLEAGDLVSFTDMDGVSGCYAVVKTEILSPGEIEAMELGDWDLTLFTCTYGGRSRVTVRCKRSDNAMPN